MSKPREELVTDLHDTESILLQGSVALSASTSRLIVHFNERDWTLGPNLNDKGGLLLACTTSEVQADGGIVVTTTTTIIAPNDPLLMDRLYDATIHQNLELATACVRQIARGGFKTILPMAWGAHRWDDFKGQVGNIASVEWIRQKPESK